MHFAYLFVYWLPHCSFAYLLSRIHKFPSWVFTWNGLCIVYVYIHILLKLSKNEIDEYTEKSLKENQNSKIGLCFWIRATCKRSEKLYNRNNTKRNVSTLKDLSNSFSITHLPFDNVDCSMFKRQSHILILQLTTYWHRENVLF